MFTWDWAHMRALCGIVWLEHGVPCGSVEKECPHVGTWVLPANTSNTRSWLSQTLLSAQLNLFSVVPTNSHGDNYGDILDEDSVTDAPCRSEHLAELHRRCLCTIANSPMISALRFLLVICFCSSNPLRPRQRPTFPYPSPDPWRPRQRSTLPRGRIF